MTVTGTPGGVVLVVVVPVTVIGTFPLHTQAIELAKHERHAGKIRNVTIANDNIRKWHIGTLEWQWPMSTKFHLTTQTPGDNFFSGAYQTRDREMNTVEGLYAAYVRNPGEVKSPSEVVVFSSELKELTKEHSEQNRIDDELLAAVKREDRGALKKFWKILLGLYMGGHLAVHAFSGQHTLSAVVMIGQCVIATCCCGAWGSCSSPHALLHTHTHPFQRA